jgi:hypothetical protein
MREYAQFGLSPIEYVITSEDPLKGVEDPSSEEVAAKLRQDGQRLHRENIRYYEKKVLQTESERLQKEKENLQLKDSISQLRKVLLDKERELHRYVEHSSSVQPVRAPIIIWIGPSDVRTLQHS